MQPSFDLRLRAMAKALSQVVIPAIDKTNRQAQEQAQLVLGSLEVLRQQVDHAQWFEAADLASLCNLAEELSGVAGLAIGEELPAARKRGVALLGRWDVSLPQLRGASNALREMISEIVESIDAQNAESVMKAATRVVMEHAKEQIARERAFVAPMKWDGYPDSLLSVEDSLRRAAPLRDATTP